MELCEERQLLMRLQRRLLRLLRLLQLPVMAHLAQPLLQPPVLLVLAPPMLLVPVLLVPAHLVPVLLVLVPVDRAMVKVMEMGTASAREETTGMATTATGMATVTGMAMGTGTGAGTVLATAAEMDTEIAAAPQMSRYASSRRLERSQPAIWRRGSRTPTPPSQPLGAPRRSQDQPRRAASDLGRPQAGSRRVARAGRAAYRKAVVAAPRRLKSDVVDRPAAMRCK